MQDIAVTVHTFKEGKMFVAYVPELDLSSCGTTDEEARKNIRDAVRGFLETSAEMGTLAEILEEAGYARDGDTWRSPEFVSLDRLTMSVK
jgi:predicted RNase H-like HicB family nuclease